MKAQEYRKAIYRALEDSKLMLSDLNTFQYIRTEGYPALRKLALGGGNLTMLLVEMSVIGFISKLYYVLAKGSGSYVTQEDIKKFEMLVAESKPSASIRQYIRRPRLREINETRAVTKLLYTYPNNIGIPKDKEVIGQMWNDLRNRLVHLSRLGRDNVAITSVCSNCRYGDFVRLRSSTSRHKSFHLDKDLELRKTLLEKRKEPEWQQSIYQATSNNVYVDRLLGDIEKIYEWLSLQIANADENQLSCVVDWLSIDDETE